jgi:hypothetical protein
MRYQDFVRAAAGVLATALCAGGAFAQAKQPEPVTMVDTAPLPASDRSSVGAVVLMEQPVLAQREEMAAMQERSAVDTRSMGAGPARVLRDAMVREQLRRQRELDGQRVTPK